MEKQSTTSNHEQPASGIDGIVKQYVKLGNLVALSEQKLHRLKLLSQHKDTNEHGLKLVREHCQKDIAAIDAGIRELLKREPSRGHVDACSPEKIAGWAQYIRYPELPVTLRIYRDQEFVAQIIANRYRRDLAEANLGSGQHGFEFIPPKELFDGAEIVQVKTPEGAVLGEYRSATPARSDPPAPAS